MSTFEPTVVISSIKNSGAILLKEKKDFEVKWKAAVSYFVAYNKIGRLLTLGRLVLGSNPG